MQVERILNRTLGKTQRRTDVFSIFTRILIIVHVLASAQREPVS